MTGHAASDGDRPLGGPPAAGRVLMIHQTVSAAAERAAVGRPAGIGL